VLQHVQLATGELHPRALGIECSAKDYFLRVLGDVDEASRAVDRIVHLGHIDVTCPIHLRHPEKRDVDSTAAVEVKLRRRVDDRLVVGRSAQDR